MSKNVNVKPKNRKSGKAAAIRLLETSLAQEKEVAAKQHVLNNPLAKQLLERGIDLIVKSNNAGLTDPVAKSKADGHSELLRACNSNLATAIRVIMETPTVDDLTKVDRRGGRVYSLLSAVMKRCMFLASGRYHLWLNGRDQPLFAARDDQRQAPYGLQFDEDAFIDAELSTAMEQLQAFFGGLVEVSGYDMEGRAFPFTYDEDVARGWFPITDLNQAYVVVEERAKKAQIRRLEEAAKLRREQVAAALKLMEASLSVT